MSEQIFERHRFGAALLRRLLRHPAPEDREDFAAACLLYARAYLQRNARRWAAGFDFDFASSLYSAADLAVSTLLRMEGDPPRLRRLEKELEALCRRRPPAGGPAIGDPPDGEGLLRTADDEYLLLQIRHLVRLKCGQAMILEWKKTNPEKWKAWNRFKVHAGKMDGVRIEKDARGWFVCDGAADLGRRPMSREEVADALGAGCGTVRRALELLAEEFGRRNGHGGYCVLSDLVLVYLDLAASKLVFDGNGTGAVPPSLGPARTESGIPYAVWIDRVRHDVHAMADDFLRRDESKNGTAFGPVLRRALGEVVVEVVCRKFDMGRQAYSGYSQRDLALFILPGVDERTYEESMRERIDYTVRRVRRKLRRPAVRGKGGEEE